MAEPFNDSEENRKWFIDRVDSVIQNIIDIMQSDYDNFSSSFQETDEALSKYRNVVWQIIAVIAATAIAVAQVGLLGTDQLIFVISILGFMGLVWTLAISLLKRAFLPRMGRVDDVYAVAELNLLYIQGWFQNNTMTPSKVTQEQLDLYYDFVRTAVGSIYSSIFQSSMQFQLETRLRKPGQKLEPTLQRMNATVQDAYKHFKERRTELMNPKVFSPNLLSMLALFEQWFRTEKDGL